MGERNINVWLPLTYPLLGTWLATQACALTGNRTDGPLFCRTALSPLSHASQGLLLIFKNHFIDVWLTCKKLCMFNAYRSMSLGISICPCSHHHHQSHQHVYHLPVFSLTPVTSYLLLLAVCAWVRVCLFFYWSSLI